MRTLPAHLLAALRVLLLLSLVLGVLYPLAVFGAGRIGLADNANGSMVQVSGKVVGSDLIGQAFTDPTTGAPLPQFFQSRASNAGDGYDPTSTAASNRGPEDVLDTADRTSLLTLVCTRSKDVGALEGVDGRRPRCGADVGQDSAVPPDAVTASGSGLDPHISPAYARLQVARVAQARGLPVARVEALVEDTVQGRTLGFLGEPRVNVLRLNIALEQLQ